ncbi:2OG-Fe(II) oxygenase superfamily domain-containing protein [Ditylenchus destructor]|uniref:2OG-Fe(II) oxygenase superfamily domain-containing protein n=1 Tax=Ditylenchus destructor TaxID=166010 RepID=A0AAD4R3H1_9BILA|nr:2OG-Fe(II) oxygenase superfamily domain-containing protein [Ditylenchus destructor]
MAAKSEETVGKSEEGKRKNGTEATAASASDYQSKLNINPKYGTEEFAKGVKQCLDGNGETSSPFPHFMLKDFLQDDTNAGDSTSIPTMPAILRNELLHSARWHRKSNDLYDLHQTTDVQSFSPTQFPALTAFRKFLVGQVRRWLEKATGVQLNDKVAITGSRYDCTDTLLPHDDRLEGRAFAFVYYLTPKWQEEYGGNLLLYNAEPKTNHPESVTRSIAPVENSFMFFRVQQNSWHSVSEVLTKDKSRLSLNGWFHADNAPMAAEPAPEPPIPMVQPGLDVTLTEVEEWLNSKYVKPAQHKSIKRVFAQKSELSLTDFLNPQKYKEALDELEAAPFNSIGPPDKRKVGRLDESQIPRESAVGTLLRLVRSEAMTLLLTQWTGLNLCSLGVEKGVGENTAGKSEGGKQKDDDDSEEPAAKKRCLDGASCSNAGAASSGTGKASEVSDKDVRVVSYINRFKHGCYSMADDQLAADAKKNGYCLDLLLFFGPTVRWNTDRGGFFSYFAMGDEDEIIRVPPLMNTAAIVFREPEVLNFTKYVNCRAGSDYFYVLNCSFFGISSEDSEFDSSSSSLEEDGEDPEDDDESTSDASGDDAENHLEGLAGGDETEE